MKILILALSLMFPFAAFAQLEGNPENWCRNGFFPKESANFSVAKVVAPKGERVYFYGDEKEDCPSGKNCRLKSYLIANNEVIVSRTYGNYSCVWYQPTKGYETVSWIETKKLQTVESSKTITLNDWLGNWSHYSNFIEIKKDKKKNYLQVSGDAIWKGLGDNVHVGEMGETVKPKGNSIKIGEKETDEYACKVSLYRVGKYLIASDNLNCGGLNVTFTGVYQRKSAR